MRTSDPARTVVTFDCWGTLIEATDSSKAVEQRIASLTSIASGRISNAEAAAIIAHARREHFDAWLSGRHYGSRGIAHCCATAIGANDSVVRTLQRSFEEASLLIEFMVLDGAHTTLATLRERGVRLALVCDTGLTPGWAAKQVLDQLSLWDHFEAAAFFDEVGHPKPDPRIFKAALQALGADPNSGVHVGDMLRADIEGARRVGMKTVRITAVTPDGGAAPSVAAGVPIPDPAAGSVQEADRVVASHAELLPALTELGVGRRLM